MKKFNKLMAVLVALAMCLSMLPLAAFAATSADCEHQFLEMSYVEGIGVLYRCIKCGHEFTDPNGTKIDMCSHTCIWWVKHSAECGKPGQIEYECTKCGKTIIETIPATGNHNYVDGTCTDCGAKDPDYTEPDTECTHTNPTHVAAKAPTCTEPGNIAHWVCNDCGKMFKGTNMEEVEDVSIPAAGHTFSNEFVQAATATGGTGHAHECTVCGELSMAVPHTGTWVVTEAATCTTLGTETYVCPDCGYTDTRAIPMTDHTDENHDNVCDDCHSAICVHNMEVVSDTEATCTLPGVKVEKCTECGFTRSTVTALALGHDFSVEGEVITEPTCTEAGEMTVECSRCGATETVAIPANGHSYVNVEQKDPTCTEDGVKAHMVCTVCGHLAIGTKEYTAEELVIPAIGHNFVDGSCTDCGAKDPNYTAPDTGDGNTGDGNTGNTGDSNTGNTGDGNTGNTGDSSTGNTGDSNTGNTGDSSTGNTGDSNTGNTGDSNTGNTGDSNTGNTGDSNTGNAGSNTTYPDFGTGATDPAPQPGGAVEIEDPNVPLSGLPGDGEVEIGDVEVPLAGLMTRAEFVNYLYVQEGSPIAGLSSFTDVSADYEYALAIGWAEANGITLGVGGGMFAPDDLVTVEQANLFLERYAAYLGFEMTTKLDALAGKDPEDILDNADEVLTEFFDKYLDDNAA